MRDAVVTSFVEVLGEGEPDVGRLGGKGASLSRLVRLGLRVPEGFTVTADAFVATLDHLRLEEELDTVRRWLTGGAETEAQADAEPTTSARIRRALLEDPFPANVEAAVLGAVDDLRLWESGPDGLIVRSSATVEDSSALSFAGMFESYPIAAPEDLLPALREVWASVFAPRALSYARERGIATIPTMAVVVQRFLAAERSGVMFTRFAGPGGERILVEHVEGTCERLVRGEVTPDRLWIDPATGFPDVTDGPLAPAHADALVRVAADVEAIFGGPQDVEWCVYASEVHVVQSRPITSVAGPPTDPPSPVDGGSPPVLTGVGASAGVGSGPVHLAFNIEHALALERGSVLVTPMTNPDMVVAMRNATGIVTDVGGMICHAAIVSRELGIPCVVGTETATRTLTGGDDVTVDGSAGTVHRGILTVERPADALRPMEWPDLWELWDAATDGLPDVIPLVSSADALSSMPMRSPTVVLAPDVDLRADDQGLWRDLEGFPDDLRRAHLDAYLAAVAAVAAGVGVATVYVLPLGPLPLDDLAAAVERVDPALGVRVELHTGDPPVDLDPDRAWPEGPVAVPLGSAATILARQAGLRTASSVGSPATAIAAATDTIKFFGHTPTAMSAAMPDPAARRGWWDLLWEYGRYHKESRTDDVTGTFDWLEIRPELVISPLLKSLVQPGFEMIPRTLSFQGQRPMHVKWARGRYHFRADTFAVTWAAIVRLTWDQDGMADLMRRVRASYESLGEVLALWPTTDDQTRALTPERIVALITSWWPRWVEFFALNWFIQAQGDDVAYPFVEETVRDHVARLGPAPPGLAWPGAQDLIAPTTPVLSGAYMASLGRLRASLVEAGLTTTEAALAALDRGEQAEISEQLAEHLRAWHWMRDRDLVFEPWDTPERVVGTALRTEPHAPAAYDENLRRNRLALSFHMDLAHSSGRAAALNHHARFVHDLNVERENHHVLWLKFSYPVRRVFLEVERRLVELGSLAPGDVFFLQAPELLGAVRALPAALPPDLAAKVRNRRRGFLIEARLAPSDDDAPPAEPEDDYL